MLQGENPLMKFSLRCRLRTGKGWNENQGDLIQKLLLRLINEIMDAKTHRPLLKSGITNCNTDKGEDSLSQRVGYEMPNFSP